MSLSSDILLQGLTMPLDPIQTIELPEHIWSGRIEPKEGEEGRYKVVSKSTRKPSGLEANESLLLVLERGQVRIKPIKAEGKASDVSFEFEHGQALSGNCEVYTFKIAGLYPRAAWSTTQTLRWATAYAKKQQIEYRASGLNYLYDIATIIDAAVKRKEACVEAIGNGEDVSDYGVGITYEQAQDDLTLWQQALAVTEPLVNFVIEKGLTIPISNDEYVAEETIISATLVKAALDITKSAYLDSLPHAQITAIRQQIIKALNDAEQPLMPVVETNKKDTTEVAEKKEESDGHGRGKKTKSTQSSNSAPMPSPEEKASNGAEKPLLMS